MAYIQLKFLVLCVGILFPLTTKGAYEECVTSLKNVVVYEGTLDTMLDCAAGPNGSAWSVRPISNASRTFQMTNFDDVVSPTLTGLYAINETGLIVRNATTTNTTGCPISTAGTYIVSFNSTTRIAFKLVVIRSGPICSCDDPDAEAVNISCTIIYADHPTGPINATLNCTANGQFYNAATLTKTLVPTNTGQYVYNSTSNISINNIDPATYECVMTFAAPMAGGPSYLAKNAPNFSVTRQVFCGHTTTTEPMTTTQPTITTETLTSIEPPITTSSISTTKPPATTTPATTTTLISTTGCNNCAQNTACPSLNESCTKPSECRSDGTNLTNVYDECVVKAELYAKYDKCCPVDLVCGVVVTLRNDSRWLIHDSQCDDNKCEMVAVRASCMSSNWKLLTERKITISGVGDYVQAGNSVSVSMNMTDCSESCKRMMNLP